jgi:predicted RNase H-like HicB family nuclease
MTSPILTTYFERAMSKAEYDRLEDGSFVGTIPDCEGVITFGRTLYECQANLRSALEDWVLMGIRFGDPLPVIDDIDLNERMNPVDEQMESLQAA